MTVPFNASQWLVDRQVEAGHGDRPALLHGNGVTTYSELLELTEAAAGGLRRLGVRPEERVLLVLRDGLELAVGILATMRIGAIALPVNPLLPARDLAAIARDARARTAILPGDADVLIAGLTEGSSDLSLTIHVGEPGAGAGVLWKELITGERDGGVDATSGDSPAFWLCTSGTTGRPKLAMHRHADIRTTCDGYASEVLDIQADDRHLSAAPMFHAYGLGNSLNFPLAAAASSVLEPTRPPTPALVAGLMSRYQPSLFFAVPTFYAAVLASDIPDNAFASLRQAVSAGEALPAELFHRFRDRFGVEILDGIGSTEMTHIFISNRRGHAVPGASGSAVAGHRLRCLDEESQPVAQGVPGQLWVSGAAAATGYWCRTEETRRAFAGEWVATGDIYSVDADGIYRHLGRRDDMLKVAGEWISPAEVESVLLGHAAIAEAVVVGAHDPDGLMRPVGFVVARDGAALDAQEVIDWCRSQLAHYKCPRRLLFVDGVPKTATGKVMRAELRATATGILQISAQVVPEPAS
jgi:benzoate-CoA ligase family protein